MMRCAIYGVWGNDRTRLAHRGLVAAMGKASALEDYCWQPNNSSDYDLIVIDGFKRKSIQLINHYRSRGCNILVFDFPTIRIDGQFALRLVNNDDYKIPIFGEPNAERIALLGINTDEIEKKSRSKKILLAGQVGTDMSHGLGPSGLRSWTIDAYDALSKHGRVLWRPHPGDRWEIPDAYESAAGTLLIDDIRKCSRFATHSSTSGIVALIAGIPVGCSDIAFYSDLGSNITSPTAEWIVPERERVIGLVAQIASRQFTEDEIVSGSAFSTIMESIR